MLAALGWQQLDPPRQPIEPYWIWARSQRVYFSVWGLREGKGSGGCQLCALAPTFLLGAEHRHAGREGMQLAAEHLLLPASL